MKIVKDFGHQVLMADLFLAGKSLKEIGFPEEWKQCLDYDCYYNDKYISTSKISDENGTRTEKQHILLTEKKILETKTKQK